MTVNKCYAALTPIVFKKVKQLVLGVETPWYATMTDYYSAQPNIYSHSWTHFAIMDGKSISPLGDSLMIAALSALENSGQNVDQIIRIRLGLHSIGPQQFTGGAHVDLPYPHMVGLLYLNNGDGDTQIYNEKYDSLANTDTYQYFQQVHKGQSTIMETSTPKENKLIWFNGLHYHASQSPTTVANRVVININYTTKETKW
jgi:hypothetical protein